MKIESKQLIFSDRREITHGNSTRGEWTLYGYTEQGSGFEYSSLEGGYPLNTPISIEFTEHEVKKTKGEGVFLNRRITRLVGGETPKAEKLQGEQILAKLESIEEAVEEIKQWTRSK